MSTTNQWDGGLLLMSGREREREGVLRRVQESEIRPSAAAAHLGVSPRHLRRLRARYRSEGARGLVHGRRGQAGNRSRPQDKAAFVRWYGGLKPGGRYAPKQAAERFFDDAGIRISKETARAWMAANGLWEPRRRREPKAHPPRPRRACRGELVQADGCDHEWLPGRRWTMIVLIDDATSEVLYASFENGESTDAYLRALDRCCQRHGIPAALYSDRHSALVSPPDDDGVRPLTQVGHALSALGVEQIVSLSPQSRGRIERFHQTAQRRLCADMANALDLRGLSDDRARLLANDFLQAWIERHNRDFAKAPDKAGDQHVPLGLDPRQRRRLFASVTWRKITRNRTFALDGNTYALQSLPGRMTLQHAMRCGVAVFRHYSGELFAEIDGRDADFRLAGQRDPGSADADAKSLNRAVDRALRGRKTPWKPPANHPWRRPGGSFPAQR